MEKLEFKTESLDYSEIETRIVQYYNLGYAESSNFMEIELGVHGGYFIMASKGDIEFSAIVGKTKENQYLVIINPYKIRKEQQYL